MTREQVIEIRNRYRLTRKQFADKLFYSYALVFAVETGLRPVTEKFAARINKSIQEGRL